MMGSALQTGTLSAHVHDRSVMVDPGEEPQP
jgi:hypothetical protein